MPVPRHAALSAPPGQGDQVVPVSLGGQWSAGDPSMMPDGHVRKVSNMLLRPGPRWDSRPPAVYDNLMSVSGLLTWEDLVNQQTRFVALDATKLYMKNVANETWSAGVAGLTGTRMTDFVTYRGKVYFMMDDGAGNPVSAWVWDGTTLSGTPFNSTIVSRAIAVLDDRLFFAFPRVSVTPLGASPLLDCYDWTNTALWVGTNVIATNIIANGTTVGSLFPQSTAVNGSSIGYVGASGLVPLVGSIAASVTDLPFTWRLNIRNNDALVKLPVTVEMLVFKARALNTPYAQGDLMTQINTGVTYLYRATTAGTTTGGVIVLGTTIGGTTVDNTVTWTNIGTNVIGSVEAFVPGLTEAQATNKSGFSTIYVTALLPYRSNTVGITPNLKFYNSTQTALTVLPRVDISLKDGITDGDPRKQNYGSQITAGSYRYPFFNQETTATATVNLESIIWSEVADPKNIRGANNYELRESAGLPTAMRVVSGRLIVFKRRAFWSFVGTGDPDNPIQAEGPAKMGVGCLGPRAQGILDDELFWIGEDEIYRMRIGYPPVAIGGYGMREEILNKNAATWVESQATYNMPLLAVDKKNREVWVYTQKGKLYCYHVNDEEVPAGYRGLSKEVGAWSVVDINGTEIRALAFNPVTEELEISFGGFGLSRLDPNAAPQQDQIDNTASFFPVSKDIIFKPFELTAPRYDALLDWFAVYHLATASQAGQTLTASISFDRGGTYPKSNAVTVPLTSPRIPITIYQFAPSIVVKLSHLGSAGAAVWSLSRVEAMLRIKRGEYPQLNPQQLTANL